MPTVRRSPGASAAGNGIAGEPADSALSASAAGDAADLDAVFDGGLPACGLVEIRNAQTRDMGAATGFSLALAALRQDRAGSGGGTTLWIGQALALSEAGMPYGPGLMRHGLDPARFLLARPRTVPDALWMAETALGVPAFSAVILEIRGNPPGFGLTESRRLQMRAKAGGVLLLLLRQAGEEEASSALCRLRIEPAPAGERPLPDGATLEGSLGNPVFLVTPEKGKPPTPSAFSWNGTPMTAVSPAASPALPLLGKSGDQRILCLWFPYLPADRVARQRWGRSWLSRGRPEHPPVVFAGRSDNAMRLVFLDRQAERIGLQKGPGRGGGPRHLPDPGHPPRRSGRRPGLARGDRRLVRPLYAAGGARRRRRPHLDITGCAHLFGGESAMLADMLSRLFHQGFAAARRDRLRPPGLPMGWRAPLRGSAALVDAADAPQGRGPAAARRTAAGAGDGLGPRPARPASTAGRGMARPRAPLARRFGKALLLRLDQALGAVEEAISPRLPAPVRMAERRLATPVSASRMSKPCCRRHLVNLARRWSSAARARASSTWRCFASMARSSAPASARLAPLRDPDAIARLFHERLAASMTISMPAAASTSSACRCSACERFDPAEPAFADCFLRCARGGRSLAAFADRLAARLGIGSVLRRPALRDTHIPEQAESLLPAARFRRVPGDLAQAGPSRPSAAPNGRFGCSPARAGGGAGRGAGRAAAALSLAPPAARRVRAGGTGAHGRQWWTRARPPARDYYRIEDRWRPPLLALPRGPARRGRQAAALVRARAFRMSASPALMSNWRSRAISPSCAGPRIPRNWW